MTVQKTNRILTTCVLATGLLLALASAGSFADSAAPNDSRALHGLHSAKAVFDVTTANPKKLYFYLNLIEEASQSMQAQGVTPDFVIAFRGPATFYVSTDRSRIKPEDNEIADKIRKKIDELGHASNIHMEQCGVAARALHVDATTIYPPITVVGNSWISLIGYGNQGYALVPVQ